VGVAAGWKKQRPMEKRTVTEAKRISKEAFLTGLTIIYKGDMHIR
jgi:hypothetical protein